MTKEEAEVYAKMIKATEPDVPEEKGKTVDGWPLPGATHPMPEGMEKKIAVLEAWITASNTKYAPQYRAGIQKIQDTVSGGVKIGPETERRMNQWLDAGIQRLQTMGSRSRQQSQGRTTTTITHVGGGTPSVPTTYGERAQINAAAMEDSYNSQQFLTGDKQIDQALKALALKPVPLGDTKGGLSKPFSYADISKIASAVKSSIDADTGEINNTTLWNQMQRVNLEGTGAHQRAKISAAYKAINQAAPDADYYANRDAEAQNKAHGGFIKGVSRRFDQ